MPNDNEKGFSIIFYTPLYFLKSFILLYTFSYPKEKTFYGLNFKLNLILCKLYWLFWFLVFIHGYNYYLPKIPK